MRRIGNKRKALMTLGSLVIMFFISQVLLQNDLLDKSRESILRMGNVHIVISQEVYEAKKTGTEADIKGIKEICLHCGTDVFEYLNRRATQGKE